jgi:rod shape-determining protein MreC
MPGLFEGFIRRYRKGVTLAVLTLVSIVCLSISNRNVVIKPKEIGHSFVAFFQGGLTGASQWIGGTFNSIRELREAKTELAEARRRLAEADEATREVVALRQQNQALREQLELSRAVPMKRIAAEVIAKDHDNLSSTITVDKGMHQGVKTGMAVIAFQDGLEGLVGKVVNVGIGSCQILPLYDPGCYVSARLDRSRHEGLANGQGKDQPLLVMRYVKKLAKDNMAYGDLVVTAGLGGTYPKGINVGRVREWNAQSYETSLDILVEPIIDFDRLEYLFILDAGG